MGLTITYKLQAAAKSVADARRSVSDLRTRALRLPFKEVGPILELTQSACDFRRAAERDRWLLIQAAQHVAVDEHRYHDVIPRHLIAFSTWPGEGSEPANFGLCRYPTTIAIADPDQPRVTRTIRTGLTGWCWSSFCKTQYASDPQCGGPINFMKCHMSIVQLLDQARAAGVTVNATDPSGYWNDRRPESLLAAVGGWTPKLACFLARQRGETDERLLAEIVKYPVLEGLGTGR